VFPLVTDLKTAGFV